MGNSTLGMKFKLRWCQIPQYIRTHMRKPSNYRRFTMLVFVGKNVKSTLTTPRIPTLFARLWTHPIPGSMYDGGYMGVGLTVDTPKNYQNHQIQFRNRNESCLIIVRFTHIMTYLCSVMSSRNIKIHLVCFKWLEMLSHLSWSKVQCLCKISI